MNGIINGKTITISILNVKTTFRVKLWPLFIIEVHLAVYVVVLYVVFRYDKIILYFLIHI